MQFYLDIETNGTDFKKDKIITIQFQELDFKGNPKGDLIILKEWESSEKEIVEKFHKILMTDNVWNFIPIMTNHIYDFKFLFEKFNKYGLNCPYLDDYLYNKPLIDLKYTLVMINGLNFKGASLDQMTNKKQSGREVPNWYANKDYKKIEEYIIQETESFLEFFEKCNKHLSQLKK